MWSDEIGLQLLLWWVDVVIMDQPPSKSPRLQSTKNQIESMKWTTFVATRVTRPVFWTARPKCICGRLVAPSWTPLGELTMLLQLAVGKGASSRTFPQRPQISAIVPQDKYLAPPMPQKQTSCICVSESATSGQPMFLVSVSGTVKFSSDSNTRCFSQTFFLTIVDETWKVLSDCYRTHDWLIRASSLVINLLALGRDKYFQPVSVSWSVMPS